MIDEHGYRHNVGIILVNQQEQVFWAKRIGQMAWQFPQGGIQHKESPEEALYRELSEEVGLSSEDVSILGRSTEWLKYRIPSHLQRSGTPICIGQKQRWFLLLLNKPDSQITLNLATKPEFDDWQWVTYWYPLREVVKFKRDVYRKALKELLFYLPSRSRKGSGTRAH